MTTKDTAAQKTPRLESLADLGCPDVDEATWEKLCVEDKKSLLKRLEERYNENTGACYALAEYCIDEYEWCRGRADHLWYAIIGILIGINVLNIISVAGPYSWAGAYKEWIEQGASLTS